MSILDRFRKDWISRFPSDSPPHLVCLIPTTTSERRRLPRGSLSAASGQKVAVGLLDDQNRKSTFFVGIDAIPSLLPGEPTSFNRDSVERSLKTFEANVENLERQLDQNRFVVQFLRDILSPLPASDVDTGTKGAGGGTAATSADPDEAVEAPVDSLKMQPVGFQPVAPARQRRKAVRDRVTSQELLTDNDEDNQGLRPPNWRTSVYEEVVPVPCIADLETKGEPTEDNRLSCRPSAGSTSPRRSRSDQDHITGIETKPDDLDYEHVPLRSGAARGRTHASYTPIIVVDDGNTAAAAGATDSTPQSSSDADNDLDVVVKVGSSTPPAGRRRFSVVPRTVTNSSPLPLSGPESPSDDVMLCIQPQDGIDMLQSPAVTKRSPSPASGSKTRLFANGIIEQRTENLMATITSNTGATTCLDEDKLQMRKWVANNIIESERAYLATLDILLQLAQTFRNMLNADDADVAVLSESDVNVIFCSIPELHHAHDLFVTKLEPLVNNWTDGTCVAEPIKMLALEENRVAADFLKNYEKAVPTIHRCWRENETFARLTKEIPISGSKDKQSIDQMLYTPVVRFQRNALVLHDLINCTPTGHPDYDPLQRTLAIARQFLENFEELAVNDPGTKIQRYIVKRGLVVEKVGETRKLRQLFLFNDVILCASVKGNGNCSAKWSICLINISLDDKVNVREEEKLAATSEQELIHLHRTTSELQSELKMEMRKCREQRQNSFNKKNRAVNKLKRRLAEQQMALIKASPRLLFCLHDRHHNRQYMLLMASEYERSTWRTAILNLLSNVQSAPNLSGTELQNLIDSHKLPQFNAISLQDDMEEDLLFGTLNIKINNVNGAPRAEGLFCTVEVDSFGHFTTKAKTTIISGDVASPTWNEDFEIELVGARTVRVLVNSKDQNAGSTLTGMCALELANENDYQFENKTLSVNNEISLVISMAFNAAVCRENPAVKTPTNVKLGAVFGAKIETVDKYDDSSSIPFIVGACVHEVEVRGMKEEGLYRISGSLTEIKNLKKAFDKSSKAGYQLIKSADIAAITATLKLYFRELPEPLFTHNFYREFVNATGLSDPEAKERYVVLLLKKLPDPNRSTVRFLADHLIKVASHAATNRMNLNNLATVFGPTLLQPPPVEPNIQTIEQMFHSGARDVVMQTQMLLVVLTLRERGVAF